MKKFTLALALSLGLLQAGSVFAANCKDDATYGEVSHDELVQLSNAKGATIVDVNGKASYAKSHVPGAIHYGANKDSFTTMLPADKSTLIVAYCGGPKCSAWKEAATKACEAGYTNIKHYKGGISGWNKAKNHAS